MQRANAISGALRMRNATPALRNSPERVS